MVDGGFVIGISCLSWVEAAILDCAEAPLSHDGASCRVQHLVSPFEKNSPLKTFLFLQLSNVVGCLSRRDRRRQKSSIAQVAHHRWGVGTVLSELDIPTANLRQRPGTKPMDNCADGTVTAMVPQPDQLDDNDGVPDAEDNCVNDPNPLRR